MKKIKHNFNIIQVIIFLVFPFAILSCKDSKDEPKIEEEDPTPRTVLVYMVAGSSSLGGNGYDRYDINEMIQGAQDGQIGKGRLLVYHSPYASSQSECVPMLKEITAEGVDTLKIYPKGTVSVTEEQMAQVVLDVKEIAPAEDYGLVLWGHGSGWLQNGIEAAPRAYSYGGDFSKYMNVTNLRNVIEGQNFSFIYFDCCYMSNVETAYELRNSTPVIVGSPTEDPIYGMPYQENLKYFFSEVPDMEGAAKSTFDYNMKLYTPTSCPVSMSVVYTAHLNELARLTRLVYSNAESSWPADYQPQRLCRQGYQEYSTHFDLLHYINRICTNNDLLEDWETTFHKAVPYAEASPYIWGVIELTDCNGLSTYILNGESSINTKNYADLQWYADVASAFKF